MNNVMPANFVEPVQFIILLKYILFLRVSVCSVFFKNPSLLENIHKLNEGLFNNRGLWFYCPLTMFCAAKSGQNKYLAALLQPQ